MDTPNSRLKNVIKDLPVTYDSLADESGISKSTWQRAIKKDGHIGIDILTFLSKKYNIISDYIVSSRKVSSENLSYNEWLEAAAIDEIRIDIGEVNEPDIKFSSSSLDDYEAQLVAILDEVERTFSNDEAKLQFVEVMLRMIRKRKAKLDDLDS